MFKLFAQIGKDSFILAMGSISTSALGFFLVPLYTRVFSTTEYGTIEILNITAQMAGIIMALGMASAFYREYLQIADTEEQRMEALSTAFLFIGLFGLLVCALGITASSRLASFLNLDTPIVPSLFRLIFIKAYFLALGTIALYYMISVHKMALYAFFSFLSAFFIMLVSIWIILFQRKGLYDLYLGQTIVVAVFGVGYSIFILRRAGFRWSLGRLKNMLFFALPMVPSAISFYVMNSSDRFFLQKFTSTEEVGIYGVSYKIGLLLSLLIVGPLTTAISPYIYRIAKREDCGDIIQHLFDVVCFVLFVSAAGLSLTSSYVIRILAPEPYWGASSIVIFISVAYALYGLNYILVAGINISGKSYYQMIAIFIAAMLNLLLNLLLIPRFGMTGAAMATTAAYFVQAVLTAIFAQRLYWIPYRFLRALTYIFIILISYYVLNSVDVETTILTIIVKSLSFALVSGLVASVFFKQEISAVLKNLRFPVKVLPTK